MADNMKHARNIFIHVMQNNNYIDTDGLQITETTINPGIFEYRISQTLIYLQLLYYKMCIVFE